MGKHPNEIQEVVKKEGVSTYALYILLVTFTIVYTLFLNKCLCEVCIFLVRYFWIYILEK